ncbi:hypothetical protein BDF14DRAFT_1836214 [Spinellus fusiger]|nr:hypothetical protein BDF14DRAFT_1836214 [Spinellus fusiger]
MSSPSSATATATSLLGTYLLQGWIMTDEQCQTPECVVPIMCSKDRSVKFCVIHDPLPTGSAGQKKPINTSATIAEVHSNSKSLHDTNTSKNKEADTDSELELDDEWVGMKSSNSALQTHRREQSSKASQLIGQKLLQRWTLLNDICPNEQCYAVPLMRNPANKHMLCVICEQTYITEDSLSTVNSSVAEKSDTMKATQVNHKREHITPEANKSYESCFDDAEEKIPTRVAATEQTKTVAVNSPTSVETASTKLDTVFFNSNSIINTLSSKLSKMTNQVQECEDPVEAKKIFEAIRACADAISACVGASEVCTKASQKSKF